MKIILNTSVTHLEHGLGIVVAQWGAWKACRTCFCPIDYEKPCECNIDGTFMVGGKGVYDVRFSDGVRSIHRDWLRRPAQLEKRAA